MRRRSLVVLLPLVLIITLALAVEILVIPRVEIWIQSKLESELPKHLPYEVKIKKLSLFVLPPIAELSEVEFTPQGQSKQPLEKFNLEKISVHLNLFQLATGRFNISAVLLKNGNLSLNMDNLPSNGGSTKIPIDDIIKLLDSLPIQNIIFDGTQVGLFSKNNNYNFSIKNLNFQITNLKTYLSGHLEIENISGSLKNSKFPFTQTNLKFSLDNQKFVINTATIQSDGISIYLQGQFTELKNLLTNPEGNLDFQTDLELSNLQDFINPIWPNLNKINTSGKFASNGTISLKKNFEYEVNASIRTDNITINNFKIGDSKISGKYKSGELFVSNFNLSHTAGSANLKNSTISIKSEEIKFNTLAEIENLDLQALFLSLKLYHIPVDLMISGDLPCQGTISPNFQIKCTGSLLGKSFEVRNDYPKKSKKIVAIDEFEAKGEVTVNSKQVTYNSDLKINQSTGKSDGVIDYHTGFKINYSSDNLNIKDITNLIGLNFEGNFKVTGNTEGDSNAATLDMDVVASDFQLDSYFLGKVDTHIAYKSGHLILNDMVAELGVARYLGEIDFNLNSSTFTGDITFPNLELSNIAQIFKHKLALPFSVNGVGKGELRFNGPIDFWKLNYSLKAEASEIKIGDERFEKLQFDIFAESGNIVSQNVKLINHDSEISVVGSIKNDYTSNLKIVGRQLLLEDSTVINRLNSSLTGVANFTAQITENIFSPDLSMQIEISDTKVGEEEYADSMIYLNKNTKAFVARANLLGSVILIDSKIPFKLGEPLFIKSKINGFDFTRHLSQAINPDLFNEYYSKINLDLDLSSQTGDINKLTGKIESSDFYLSRGDTVLQHEVPAKIFFNNGKVTIDSFRLHGSDQLIEVSGGDFSLFDIDVQAKMNVNARIFQIFMPFIDDLSGRVSLSGALKGNWLKPVVLGQGLISNGQFKVKNFPHAFEKIDANINFTKSKINISTMKGNFAGGIFSGDGEIILNSLYDIPVNIRTHVQNISLNVPEQVKTVGNADLTIVGNWFPYLITGTYFVRDGLFEKDLSSFESDIKVNQRKAFLPKFLKDSNPDPFNFDIQLIIEKPYQITNSLINAKVTGGLQIKGNPSQPGIIGKLSTSPISKFKFRDTDFEITNSVITFDSLEEVNPEVYLTSQSKVNEYDISLVIQGRSKNPMIKMSSIPALSEQELVSLLALGFTSNSSDSLTQTREQQLQTARNMGIAIFGQQLTKGFKGGFDKLGVNVQIGTSYDSTKNISVPKATVTKKLGDNWSASASRLLIDSEHQEFNVNYQFNYNWSAVGSYEELEPDSTSLTTSNAKSKGILGFDLEYKLEFK